jgi:hypothetical protein
MKKRPKGYYDFRLFDCRCGSRLFVLDLEASAMSGPFTALDELVAHKTARRIGRRFVNSQRNAACPKCDQKIELAPVQKIVKFTPRGFLEVER